MDEPSKLALTAKVMENHPWQKRLRAAGLTQRILARLMGRPEITISRQLRGHFEGGTPKHLIAVILAWEHMTPEQRQAWQTAADEIPVSPESHTSEEAPTRAARRRQAHPKP